MRGGQALSPEALSRFAHVNTWVFDLDNTLYPPHADIWPKVDARITLFIANHLGLDGISARAMQKYYYQVHGTTLNGLMKEHGVDPHTFLDFVHAIDRSSLLPDAALDAALAALPGRKFIFTNGSCGHAEATLRQLGIAAHFDDIFDIIAADFIPKPAEQPYHAFLARHGINPAKAAMLEDIPHNLAVPKALGMRTILVVPDGRGDHKEVWERHDAADQSAPGFDAVTDHLPGFLTDLAHHLQTPQA
jgi:putative hydrolase of the HAD superfamily